MWEWEDTPNNPKRSVPVKRIRALEILEATLGGTREHILQILIGLDKSRFELSLICSLRRHPAFAEDVERLRREGVWVEVVPMAREIRPWEDLRAFLAIVRHIALRRYDVVHTHSSKAGFLGRLAAWLCGVRRIYHTPHIFYFQFEKRPLRRWFYCTLERLAGLFTSKLVALSEHQAKVALEHRIVPPGRVCVIENGVDVPPLATSEQRDRKRRELGIDKNDLAVGMVARLARQKGCEHYVRVARRVADLVPSARFFLVGKGELEGRIRALAEKHQLGDRFVMLGHREDALEIYPALDLFVLTSLWEGLPYVILEAMAAGLPVVGTNVPGTRDLIADGETGYLVDSEDEAEMAEKIVHLLRNPEKRRRMGQRGRELVSQRFTRTEFLRKITVLYSNPESLSRKATET